MEESKKRIPRVKRPNIHSKVKDKIIENRKIYEELESNEIENSKVLSEDRENSIVESIEEDNTEEIKGGMDLFLNCLEDDDDIIEVDNIVTDKEVEDKIKPIANIGKLNKKKVSKIKVKPITEDSSKEVLEDNISLGIENELSEKDLVDRSFNTEIGITLDKEDSEVKDDSVIEEDSELKEESEILEDYNIEEEPEIVEDYELEEEPEILVDTDIKEDYEFTEDNDIEEDYEFTEDNDIEEDSEFTEDDDIEEENEIAEEDSELEEESEIVEDYNIEEDSVIEEDSELKEESEILEDYNIEEEPEIVGDNNIEEEFEFTEGIGIEKDSEIAGESELSEDNIIEEDSEFVEDSVIEEDSETEEDSDIEEESEFVEDNKVSVINKEDNRLLADKIKEEMLKDSIPVMSSDNILEDSEGNTIETRVYTGTYDIRAIPINKIKLSGVKEDRMRLGDLGTVELQSQMRQFGQLVPIHVVPFGEGVLDENGKKDYKRYILINGERRLESAINIGNKKILALVDSTIPRKLISMYASVINNQKEFTFTEKVKQARNIREDFPTLPYATLENMTGFKSGEYLKAEYIILMKEEFPSYVKDVENNKLTIDQAFKKLEKEKEKAEKDDGSNESEDTEDVLRDKQNEDLSEVQNKADKQGINDRHSLDRVLRRTIELRDEGICQCCGFGSEVEEDSNGDIVEKKYTDLNSVFNVHHMVAVQYGGSDSEENLILLCSNCHKLAHDYESATWIPSKDTYNDLLWVRKVVVLGNILQKTKKESLDKLKKDKPMAYKLVENKKKTLGQTLHKEGIFVDAEKTLFGGSPYRTYLKEADSLEKNSGISELGRSNFITEDDTEDNVLLNNAVE